MISTKVKLQIEELTSHSFIEIVSRGNAAITAALSIFAQGSSILIPAEGGWIHYQKGPQQLKLIAEEVQCIDATIDIADLKIKLAEQKYVVFLYQNPGGYFARQPMKEIYELCRKHDCLVVMDVSGSIGTALCDGQYADILVGSFGKEKLVEAKVGGFISCRKKKLWKKIIVNLKPLSDETSLSIISQKLEDLPQRIAYLRQIIKKIVRDLSKYAVLHPQDQGLVVVIAFNTDAEKENIIDYCHQHSLPGVECPRYIRVKRKAISIEVKRL